VRQPSESAEQQRLLEHQPHRAPLGGQIEHRRAADPDVA